MEFEEIYERHFRDVYRLLEGDYPGLSDVPVTAEQAAPGVRTMRALRGQRYTRLPFFLTPAEGGIAVRECIGCTPDYVAYWDGTNLWLPGKEEGQWLGYAPSSPEQLDAQLNTICNDNWK